MMIRLNMYIILIHKSRNPAQTLSRLYIVPLSLLNTWLLRDVLVLARSADWLQDKDVHGATTNPHESKGDGCCTHKLKSQRGDRKYTNKQQQQQQQQKGQGTDRKSQTGKRGGRRQCRVFPILIVVFALAYPSSSASTSVLILRLRPPSHSPQIVLLSFSL